MADLRGRAILGTFFHAPVRGEIEVLADTFIAVDEHGAINAVLKPDQPGYADACSDADDTLVRLPPGFYGLPGLVDLHIHAPQYPQLGLALDLPLADWLEKYTFALEARYCDLDFARGVYSQLVSDLLAQGTTTALYFATVHRAATELLAEICLAKGQRALVGKVVMDDPAASPQDCRDASTEAALADTRALIAFVRDHPGNAEGLVQPVITPRFIPSCTDDALAGLGTIAAETGAHVQTHCSESDWAHGHVLDRYGHTDAEALDRFGLLTRKSVLAHANFLTDADMERVAARGAAVAHCPLSNAYFANAVFPLGTALDRGIHVGLGTDISGGPSASMLESCRSAVQVSRMLEDGVDPGLPADRRGRGQSRIDLATAFHLATAGGGMALDMPIGIFAPGYQFDCLAIDTSAPTGGIRLFGATDLEMVFEKIVYGATRANIPSVWVSGRNV